MIGHAAAPIVTLLPAALPVAENTTLAESPGWQPQGGGASAILQLIRAPASVQVPPVPEGEAVIALLSRLVPLRPEPSTIENAEIFELPMFRTVTRNWPLEGCTSVAPTFVAVAADHADEAETSTRNTTIGRNDRRHIGSVILPSQQR